MSIYAQRAAVANAIAPYRNRRERRAGRLHLARDERAQILQRRVAETFDGVEHVVLSVWAPASPDAGDLVGLQTQVPHRIGEAGVDTLLRIVAPQDIAHRLQEAMRKITTRELVKVQAGRRSRYRRPLPVETFEGEPGIAEWRGARDTA